MLFLVIFFIIFLMFVTWRLWQRVEHLQAQHASLEMRCTAFFERFEGLDLNLATFKATQTPSEVVDKEEPDAQDPIPETAQVLPDLVPADALQGALSASSKPSVSFDAFSAAKENASMSQEVTAEATAFQTEAYTVGGGHFGSQLPSYLERSWRWLVTGNPVLGLGLLVLFLGISFLIKYAVQHVYFPVELRVAAAGVFGIGLLVFGFRLREKKTLYGLLLQGGGIGILYLTFYSATRLDILSAVFAFVLMSVVVFGGGVLAILQNSSGLAVQAALGGFAAPFFASAEQGSHIAFFTYYLVLNLGILEMTRRRLWRGLYMLGFTCTFGLLAFWGMRFYVPRYFWSVEPFLVAFFLIYSCISLWVGRCKEKQIVLDSSLLFGLPLVTFTLQARLVQGTEFGLALSALVLGAWYLGVLWKMRQHSSELLQTILSESYLILGCVFTALTVPLALNAIWTASTWALSAAGAIWVGLRQKRLLPRVLALLLVFGAAGSFLFSFHKNPGLITPGQMLAGFFLSLGCWCISWLYERFQAILVYNEEKSCGLIAGFSGAFFWYFFWTVYILTSFSAWRFAAFSALLLGSHVLWLLADHFCAWSLTCLCLRFALVPFVGLFLWSVAYPELLGAVVVWPLGFLLFFWTLYFFEKKWPVSVVRIGHGFAAGLLLLLLFRVGQWHILRADLSTTWRFAAVLFELALLILATAPARLRTVWPWSFCAHCPLVAGVPLVLLAAGGWIFANTNSGNSAPLPFIPVLNPLDLAQVLVLGSVFFWARAVQRENIWPQMKMSAVFGLSGGACFLLMTVILARTIHAYLDVSYTWKGLGGSAVFHTACSIMWTLMAFALMIGGARRQMRTLWQVGAGLLGFVLVKMFVLDLAAIGTLMRIVSFLSVGLLMLFIGYFCPLPPKEHTDEKH